MTKQHIPYNLPYMTGKELRYISESHSNGCLAGDGPFTKRCHRWLEKYTGSHKALLTHSCTAALEMTALLLEIQPGDEIIMPSYTFVSSANAFVLRGGVPVFVDIREDTLNLNEKLIEDAITNRTKVILAVHYAGVACEMDTIVSIAKRHKLKVVEDAAQGILASYKGTPLGSIGDLGTFSFHETKNIISGEGGALLVNNPELATDAEIIREKGTDRSSFFRGEVDRYTWKKMGSSYLPGELTAAFLWAQLEEAQKLVDKRVASWEYYHQLLAPLEDQGMLRRPIIPDTCQHNGHIYYVLLEYGISREAVLNEFKKNNITAVFHYVPLHSSPAGKIYARTHNSLDITSLQSDRLIRLPLWIGINKKQQNFVKDTLLSAINNNL